MAIAIPALASDRLPNPDWPGTAASMGRYEVPALRLLAALEAASAPASVLDALRSLAAGGVSATLLLAADRAQVQVLLDGRRVTLAGAARDAALVLLGEVERGPAPTAVPLAAGRLDPSLAARVAWVGAQIQESRAHPGGPDPVAEQPGPPPEPVAIGGPLLADPARDDAGAALARGVEGSGLFLEAHLAQWLRGERSLQQIQDEAQRLPAATAGAGDAAQARGAAQADALQRQAITVAGQAWPGQAIQIEIERDRERNPEAANAGDDTGLFVATLKMQLPNLGTLGVRIRVMDRTVGVLVTSARSAALADQLPRLASALSARGLTLAQLAAAPDGAGR
jgi:hypothetical protein